MLLERTVSLSVSSSDFLGEGTTRYLSREGKILESVPFSP